MIGQIQVLALPDPAAAAEAVLAARAELLAEADRHAGSLVARGGGARAIEVRPLPETSAGPMLVVHLLVDTRDAMGANTVNTICEALGPRIAELTGGRVLLRVLSNLSDRRLARAECTIPPDVLARRDEASGQVVAGATVARAIVEANAFAEADPYRAATHNKGIMNGIDAVALATGNDWRALEAGAHAYAARGGQYRALTEWRLDEHGRLRGALELPLAAGLIGGATHSHPTAQVALKILGVQRAEELAEIMAAVGLAQNLAALRALASEGLQHGHMGLHARQLALAAGAVGALVERVAARLISENDIHLSRAQELVAELAHAGE
jgi:hydroxymethylglutaryl-CoA reductase